jgi:FkbM family methyltransferase
MQSRLDVDNDARTSGEHLVQRAFAEDVARRPAWTRLRVLDVGANVGAWSARLIERLCEAGAPLSEVELYLFEPAPEPRRAIRERLTRMGKQLAGMHIEEMALSNSTGRVSFSLLGDTAGTNTLQPMDGETAQQTITVSQSSLDAYCETRNIDRIDLMKIDTEGNDFFRVLEGARAMLENGKIAMLQFEYNHRWIAFRAYLKDVFDLAQPLGYSLGKVTPRGIECYRYWHHELESFREGNYLLWRDALPPGLPSFPWWMD